MLLRRQISTARVSIGIALPRNAVWEGPRQGGDDTLTNLRKRRLWELRVQFQDKHESTGADAHAKRHPGLRFRETWTTQQMQTNAVLDNQVHTCSQSIPFAPAAQAGSPITPPAIRIIAYTYDEA